jgi:hypothetical protein
MKYLMMPIAILASAAVMASGRSQPISSGEYACHHRFSEQPNIPSIAVTAKISGRHIVLINSSQSDVFPLGVIAEGTLMWHRASKQWIIGHNRSDGTAKEVGGCSDGPEVVDLQQKVYWTC